MFVNDVIIIGSGIAALSAAERLRVDKNVIVFTKSHKQNSNSYLAQGGIAAAVHRDDHWQEHYEDTITAGVAHADEANVKTLVASGADAVLDLIHKGMAFDCDTDGSLRLGKEGAHLRRRILHAGGDATGECLTTFMLDRLKDEQNVRIIENEMALDLLVTDGQCVGVITKDVVGVVREHMAEATILATGGCGQLYQSTSNAQVVTGDGIAMVYRAGAVLEDMEFMQFHPTLLYKNGVALSLVSEAVRGEGAYLVNNYGFRIMEGVHPLGDLAPRDVVAREIFKEIQCGRQVFLNIEDVANFADRFPTIYRACVHAGIDVDAGLLPVRPGAHFMMGGIKAAADGRTSLAGLFAVGEVACTGVHGANRIASNSLLEGIVFGKMTAERILDLAEDVDGCSPAELGRVQPVPARVDDRVRAGVGASPLPSNQEIQEKMTRLVGVVRVEADLLAMKEWVEGYDFLGEDLNMMLVEDAEIINMLTVAWLMTTSALERTESRGSHFRADYPKRQAHWLKKRILRGPVPHLSNALTL
ncbi:L-aspartate oxidase [Virgibacillus ainsalahensis]